MYIYKGKTVQHTNWGRTQLMFRLKFSTNQFIALQAFLGVIYLDKKGNFKLIDFIYKPEGR